MSPDPFAEILRIRKRIAGATILGEPEIPALVSDLLTALHVVKSLARSYLLCYMSEGVDRGPGESLADWCRDANQVLVLDARFRELVKLAEGRWDDGRFVEMNQDEIEKWLL